MPAVVTERSLCGRSHRLLLKLLQTNSRSFQTRKPPAQQSPHIIIKFLLNYSISVAKYLGENKRELKCINYAPKKGSDFSNLNNDGLIP